MQATVDGPALLERGLLAAAQLLRRSRSTQGACSELCAASGSALPAAAGWVCGGSGSLAAGLPWGLGTQVHGLASYMLVVTEVAA